MHFDKCRINDHGKKYETEDRLNLEEILEDIINFAEFSILSIYMKSCWNCATDKLGEI